MSLVTVLYHDDFMLHSPEPYQHPENPARLRRVLEALRARSLEGRVQVREPREGNSSVFTSVHSPSYLKYVLSLGDQGVSWIDADTYVSPGTRKAVARLAGAADEAVSLALEGGKAFIAGRPPGHHAGIAGRALGAPTNGFCIVNTAALVARMLSARSKPVVVVDFDLHHGNGTQEIFWDDPNIIHIDIHQDPATIYPGVGFPEDLGTGEAKGTKVNIVTPPYSGDDIYMHALSVVRAIVEEVKPDYIVFSAGFDAYRGDNDFTVMNVGSRFYWEAGRTLSALAKGVVAVLEGGYGVGLERGLEAFMAGLTGLSEDPVGDRESASMESALRFYSRALARLKKALKEAGSPYWDVVEEPGLRPS